MRYPQGGGLTAERQRFRERVRMEAVAMFAAGRGSTDIAKELRVSVRSVQRWRQTWRAAGQDGVRSRGPASRPKLSESRSKKYSTSSHNSQTHRRAAWHRSSARPDFLDETHRGTPPGRRGR
ncbi:helix-turn-helix domain-containing protein [Streptomyces sp. NBC_00145]